MSIVDFFKIPLVKFSIHVLIVTGAFVNMYQLYRVWEMNEVNKQETNMLNLIKQQNSDARNQRDYFKSQLYKEKFAKEQNYKNKGEQVIDTSVIEPTIDNVDNNYIPDNKKLRDNNIQKWWDFFFAPKE